MWVKIRGQKVWEGNQLKRQQKAINTTEITLAGWLWLGHQSGREGEGSSGRRVAGDGVG